MRSIHAWLILAIVALAFPGRLEAQTSAAAGQADNPFPYGAGEAKAKVFSFAKGVEYLDSVAQFWMQPNSCGACHANFAYVMARPLGERSDQGLALTRRFLEKRPPHREFSFDAHAVAIAFALAWDDARTSRTLQPATRNALRRMWSTQRDDGTWARLGCGEYLPSENDRYYTVVLAGIAAGVAPEGYARTAEAHDGLTRLRRYFVKNSPRNLHDQALLLWASLHLDGLLTASERQITIKSLLARQGKDGGWSFAAMSSAGGTTRTEPSDGYSTGLAIYVLRTAGVPATRPEIARGAQWLRGNQRVSGRWFTPTHTADDDTEGRVGKRDLYVQNLGTAFTVMALYACGERDEVLLTTEAPRHREFTERRE